MNKFRLAIVAAVFAFPALAHAAEFPADWMLDDDAKTRAAHAALEGKPTPALSLSDWVNGEVTSEQMKGKVVIVDFYATWCGPCIEGIPHNNDLLKKYKDKGLLIVGVCTNEKGQEKMAQTAKTYHMQYPTARDRELKSEKAWAVEYYPTYAVVDRNGIVRAIGLMPEKLEEAVKKLLDEPVKAAAKK